MAMTAYRDMEEQLLEALDLGRRPVAVAFRATPPAGVAAFAGVMASGCSFWRLAAEGRTFYTVASDHYNCPIGSYTHNIALPQERAHELDDTLSLMTSAGYIKMEEVPGIPRLAQTPGVVVYAPLADSPVDPDVVIFAGRPGRMMLLAEAAVRAGVAAQPPLLARPTCMALPAAMGQGLVTSTACIGNRVYTELSDDDLYVMVAGKDLAKVVDALQTVAAANRQLADYHRAKRRDLESVDAAR